MGFPRYDIIEIDHPQPQSAVLKEYNEEQQKEQVIDIKKSNIIKCIILVYEFCGKMFN